MLLSKKLTLHYFYRSYILFECAIYSPSNLQYFVKLKHFEERIKKQQQKYLINSPCECVRAKIEENHNINKL